MLVQFDLAKGAATDVVHLCVILLEGRVVDLVDASGGGDPAAESCLGVLPRDGREGLWNQWRRWPIWDVDTVCGWWVAGCSSNDAGKYILLLRRAEGSDFQAPFNVVN